jgi:hypothetical protein
MEAVNKVLAKAAGVSTSSAAGKVQGGAAALRGTQQFHIYDIGSVVMAEMVIRYTQRARLVRVRSASQDALHSLLTLPRVRVVAGGDGAAGALGLRRAQGGAAVARRGRRGRQRGRAAGQEAARRWHHRWRRRRPDLSR